MVTRLKATSDTLYLDASYFTCYVYLVSSKWMLVQVISIAAKGRHVTAEESNTVCVGRLHNHLKDSNS